MIDQEGSVVTLLTPAWRFILHGFGNVWRGEALDQHGFGNQCVHLRIVRQIDGILDPAAVIRIFFLRRFRMELTRDWVILVQLVLLIHQPVLRIRQDVFLVVAGIPSRLDCDR